MKTLQFLPFLCFAVILLVSPFECASTNQNDSEYWNQLSSEALHASLLNKYNQAAKNVILFLGDGMGIR